MTPSFTNPWAECWQDGTGVRLQTFIKQEEHEFLKLLRPNTGTLTTTVNILVAKLINELKSRGITDITHRDAFEHFVANSILTLPGLESGSPSPRSNRKTNASNVGGGTKKPRAKVA